MSSQHTPLLNVCMSPPALQLRFSLQAVKFAQVSGFQIPHNSQLSKAINQNVSFYIDISWQKHWSLVREECSDQPIFSCVSESSQHQHSRRKATWPFQANSHH